MIIFKNKGLIDHAFGRIFALAYDLQDETYKMQTFLFDVICGLGEQLRGEPL
jgi:hypothetical protein